MSRLRLYTRENCGLCERMQADLREELGPAVAIDLVDIDADSALLARFATRVPVLAVDNEIICFGWLDRARLHAALGDDHPAR